MEFVQKFTPPDFQAKNFTPSISPNFNSFSGKKTQKNEWKWINLHRWQKFYTVAGSDGIDKFHLWQMVHNWSLEYWDRANNVSCASRLIWSDIFCCVLIKFLLQKEKVRVLKSSIQVQIGRMIAGRRTLKCSIFVHIRELLVNIACCLMHSFLLSSGQAAPIALS